MRYGNVLFPTLLSLLFIFTIIEFEYRALITVLHEAGLKK